MTRRLVVALAVAGLLLAGCSSEPGGQVASPSVAASPATGSRLPPLEFAAAAGLPGTVLVDVRTPAEFAAGHLAGAVNIDLQSAGFASSLSDLDRDASYAVYCRSGSRSQAAMAQMQSLGFRTVFDLAGGVHAWTADGGELVTA